MYNSASAVLAPRFDWTVYAGAIIPATITLLDSAGNPVVPSSNVKLTVRSSYTAKPILLWQTNKGITIVSNLLSFPLPLNIKGGRYIYDIAQENSDGSITPFMYGDFIVIQNVTNAIV